MATEKGKDGFDRIDGHLGRGGAAFGIDPTAEGDLIGHRLTGAETSKLRSRRSPTVGEFCTRSPRSQIIQPENLSSSNQTS